MSEIWYKSGVVGMYYMCRAIRRKRRAKAGDTCGDKALSSRWRLWMSSWGQRGALEALIDGSVNWLVILSREWHDKICALERLQAAPWGLWMETRSWMPRAQAGDWCSNEEEMQEALNQVNSSILEVWTSKMILKRWVGTYRVEKLGTVSREKKLHR